MRVKIDFILEILARLHDSDSSTLPRVWYQRFGVRSFRADSSLHPKIGSNRRPVWTLEIETQKVVIVDEQDGDESPTKPTRRISVVDPE